MNTATNPLTTLREYTEAHWREYCPGKVADLEAQGALDKAIDQAVERTENAILDAVAEGADFWAAWELYREKWAFLPAEDDDEEILLPPEEIDDDWEDNDDRKDDDWGDEDDQDDNQN